MQNTATLAQVMEKEQSMKKISTAFLVRVSRGTSPWKIYKYVSLCSITKDLHNTKSALE